MKRLYTIIAVLFCLGSTVLAQKVGNCTYEPSLDTPQHKLTKLGITFEDYQSVSLANAEKAIIYVYRTSLEKEKGQNSVNAMEYFTYADGMKCVGNKLTFYPEKYHTSGTATRAQHRAPGLRKGWGQDTNDYLRVAIPAHMLKAVDKQGNEVLLDSLSYSYIYTAEEEPFDEKKALEYVLTPANGETVKTLNSFTLEFPNCQGVFTLNYDQRQDPYVLNDKGETVMTSTRMFDNSARHSGLIALKSIINKAGVYTLVIPEASYHMSPSVEAWSDSIKHPEIRATYTVLGSDERTWESVPADGSTVTSFDGIHITFSDKKIASKNPNVGGGNLKVYNKADDKYPEMIFQYYFAKNDDHTIHFTTASQISKVKENATYYLDLPFGLLTFDDGTQNEGLHVEFTYNPNYTDGPALVEGDNYVGYTTSAVQRKNGVRFNSGAEQGMLIYLPKEKTANLAGCTIKAIRTATGTTQLDTPRLVIIEGDDVNQTPVVEQSTGKFSTSMKDYALDAPYTIAGDKALYVGFKCSLSAEYKPMLFDETLDLPAGLAWALTDNGWEDITSRGYGAPNIQILLDKNVDAADVLVKPFQTSVYNKVGDDMSISTQIFNYGLQEVKSFDITYKIGSDPAIVKSVTGISLPQGSAYDINIDDATISSSGRLPLVIEVTNINGADDVEPTDNKQTSSAFIYPADMSKKVLWEEFTGQTCVNCPSGTATVNRVLADYEGQYVEVYHHAGYADDNFTTRDDIEYTWFYNNGSNTYAPGGMANRHPALLSLTTAVVQSNDMGSVMASVQSAMLMAPYVGIGMQNEFDNNTRTGKVSIDVTCYELPSDQEHSLNVWLVQDGVVRYQNGSGVISHDNAFRKSLSGTWGKSIKLNEGETQTLTFDYSIPETIVGEYATYTMSAAGIADVDDKNVKAVPSNMRIVAFVADKSENALKCTVWNAEECPVTDHDADAIEGFREQATSSVVYDMQGRQIRNSQFNSQLNRGVYIVNGKKVLR